jgi:hypothetical protein
VDDPVKRGFDEHFASYGMSLPEDWAQHAEGTFEEGGWDVHYIKHDGFLELYATHRRTNDRLYRVHGDGRVEMVDATTDGILPDHDARFDDRVRRGGHM